MEIKEKRTESLSTYPKEQTIGIAQTIEKITPVPVMHEQNDSLTSAPHERDPLSEQLIGINQEGGFNGWPLVKSRMCSYAVQAA